MSQLLYLVREICAGVEIYYTGRSEGQYLKSAFILCDDYTELTAKLYLMSHDPHWTATPAAEVRKYDEAKQRIVAAQTTGTVPVEADVNIILAGINQNRFKNYEDVLNEARTVAEAKRHRDLGGLDRLHLAMKERRKTRNQFFHSARALEMGLQSYQCVDAFCDLLDYGASLFGPKWKDAVEAARNLDTMQLLLQLEKQSERNPAIRTEVGKIMQKWPRNVSKPSKNGSHIVEYPTDLHLRLCVVYGAQELRDKLADLLRRYP